MRQAKLITLGLMVLWSAAGCKSGSKLLVGQDQLTTQTGDAEAETKIFSDAPSSGLECGNPFESFAIIIHNQLRADNGKTEMACDSALSKVAHDYSQQMCDEDFFAAVSPGGKDTGARLDAAGVVHKVWGQNIAKGHDTPQRVMDAWFADEEHKANILGDYSKIGLGYVDCGGKHLWTAVFIKQ